VYGAILITWQDSKDGSKLIVNIETLNISIQPADKRFDFTKYAESLDGNIIKMFSKITKSYKAFIIAGL
jgi:hypothetical protein